PIRRAMVPPYRSIGRMSASKAMCMISAHSSGSSCSAMLVEPATSQKRIVTTRRSRAPPSRWAAVMPCRTIGFTRSLPHWNADNESRLAGTRVDRDFSMVLADDVVADVQTEPSSLPGLFRCEEWLEQPRLRTGRDTWAGVADLEDRKSTRLN